MYKQSTLTRLDFYTRPPYDNKKIKELFFFGEYKF